MARSFLAVAVAAALAQPAAAGENYAFLVACGQYDVKSLRPLAHTNDDITAFRDVLLQSGFPADHVVTLHDGARGRYYPEAAKVRKELALRLNGLEADDTLVVAFSGHGVQYEKDPANYFCPLDADVANKANLISLKEVYEQLDACAAGRKLLLVDACRNDPLSQIAKAAQVVRVNSKSRPQTEAVPKGIVALFSCSAGQESFEWPALKRGIFMHHVLEGWTGKAADADGRVTLDALQAYVKREMNNFAVKNLGINQNPAGQNKFEGTWVLAAKAADPKTFTVQLGGGVTMEFVRIPAGNFLRGSPDSDKDTSDAEKPQKRVRISKDFYLAKTAVTRGQFRRFVADAGYTSEPERDKEGGWGYDAATNKLEGRKPQYTWKHTGFDQTDDHPVVNVTWNDAVAFNEWLTRKIAGRRPAADGRAADGGAVGVRLPGRDRDAVLLRRRLRRPQGLRQRRRPKQQAGQRYRPRLRFRRVRRRLPVHVAGRVVQAERLRPVRHAWQRLAVVPRLVRRGILQNITTR
ncbi:MAG: SUMF1/EgtB/PvdO family nonheme iron enzyme [Gemmataceae bacterium]